MRLFLLMFLLWPMLCVGQSGWKPEKPVELIVGAAPAGANDRIGRSIQRMLQESKLANPRFGAPTARNRILPACTSCAALPGLCTPTSRWPRMTGPLANVPTLREQGIDVDANVFYTIFGPKGLDAAQTAYWDQAISRVMQSELVRKDLEMNYWTIDLIGHRELPSFLERQHESYRRALTDMGMMK